MHMATDVSEIIVIEEWPCLANQAVIDILGPTRTSGWLGKYSIPVPRQVYYCRTNQAVAMWAVSVMHVTASPRYLLEQTI